MSDRSLYYMAHPVAGDVARNLGRATRWLAWLVREWPELSFACSWIPYCMALDDRDPADRQRGMNDALIELRHCDGIVLVGPKLTAGMAVELNLATTLHLGVIDYLHYGMVEPPEPALDIKLTPHSTAGAPRTRPPR